MYDFPFQASAAAGAEDAGGDRDVAREAWSRLAALVYPPRLFALARRFEISPAMLAALLQLEETRTMGQIAELLGRHPSNVTAIIDALEGRGLARRSPSGGDRRIKVIDLTAGGRELRSELIAALNEPPEWLRALPAPDQRALRDIVRRAGGET